jgi:hypothetical protein
MPLGVTSEGFCQVQKIHCDSHSLHSHSLVASDLPIFLSALGGRWDNTIPTTSASIGITSPSCLSQSPRTRWGWATAS